MKLTRSTNAQAAEFFRDSDKGKLITQKNPAIDITSDIIKALPNTKSLVGRILLKPKQHDDNNKFKNFVESLVNGKHNFSNELPHLNNNTNVEDLINNSLSRYGKNLKYNKDGLTLKELIVNYYNGIAIDNELILLHNHIEKIINFKIEKLTKSISENSIPFEIDNNQLTPQSNKMKFLFSLLKNDGVDKSSFENFEAKYNYIILQDKIKNYITQTVDSGHKILCKIIYSMVLEYNHNFYKANETDSNIDAYVFYSNEIRNHFRTYFPVKSKKGSDRINNLNEKNAIYYCSTNFVLAQVWRHIINQLVQGLIMYGKLQHYYFDNAKLKWETNKINSNGLSEIQIEEAFKKQMFLSLCFGATKLNYFYNYASNNISEFTLNNTQKNDKDIFLDFKNRNCFYSKIKKDSIKFEELRNKMATCFPIVTEHSDKTNKIYNDKKLLSEISNEEICYFLEYSVQCCYTIRNNIFHYKEASLLKVLKEKLNEDSIFVSRIITLLKMNKNELFKSIDTSEHKETIKVMLYKHKSYVNNWLYNNNQEYKEELKELSKKSDKDSLYKNKVDSLLQKDKDELIIILQTFVPKFIMAEKVSKNLLQIDINNIQAQFKEQIRSSGIADYYSPDTLEKVFKSHNLRFYLYAEPYPMMPSFRNVFTRGCNISKGNFNSDESKWFMDKGTYKNEEYLAYKNLLQIIYYNSFLPAIQSKETIITNWIDKTKLWNKELANLKLNNKYQYKYHDMPEYDSTKLSDYLSNLQHLQSIRENDENIEDDNHFTEFVKDIFVLAFNDFLQKKIPSLCGIIKSPCKQLSNTTLDDVFVSTDLSLKMKTDYNSLSEFTGVYLFLKLLDQRELNILLHQFIRYRHSTHISDEELLKIEELIALVQFTLPPPTTDENYQDNLKDYFSKFIDGDYKTEYEKFYCQEDDKTPILQRSISVIGRSGAMALYTDMFVQNEKIYTVTQSDYQQYCHYNKKLNDGLSIIEAKQNVLQDLHKQIVTARKGAYIQPQITNYENLAKEIQNYNNCRQKVTFETLYKVHQIHIDILGRFAAFAEDWERDMFFMLTALKGLGKVNFDVNKVFENGGVVGDLCGELKTNNKLFFNLCWSDDSVNDVRKAIGVRNILAHLNHMSQCYIKSIGNIEAQPSIIDIINKLRVLLAYDIKRQNAVTKSIQDLLFKDYKIKLVLEPEKTKNQPKIFKIKSLKTDNIIHLKKIKAIPIEAHDDFMISLVKKLLEFKY
ncbi:type VI-A CRISPR-associated RNA-guided ribonuclease Cas13a [Paludicola sp. MB14-C6]|uniref:type VI-A CRISPR-associated RNA-guided ribonuclease Cas13a n=1 Tax=Paludihabitans sp. MB14-C6 TaxID=3070656 RepID=UPI0027DDD47B|nr:type VI-A CRISPR-associated RNA-guided ribonuclease Cas13a [Paludicola sp. MB14-C6]WMJ22659.1 type VI-A CRISPR-associated RNA-guided ribonuclease Cas13a [Paludicola sp. MB14-C6]